jgi:hypothetical protein
MLATLDSKSKQTILPLISLLPTQSTKLAPSSASITKGTEAMEIDESAAATTATTSEGKAEGKKEVEAILPESDVYLRLLVIVGLIDVKEVEKVSPDDSCESFRITSTEPDQKASYGRHSPWPRRRRNTSNLSIDGVWTTFPPKSGFTSPGRPNY